MMHSFPEHPKGRVAIVGLSWGSNVE